MEIQFGEAKWRGKFNPGVPAEVARKEFDLIAERSEHGDVAPAEIVKQAKRKNNPLHKCFDWDDKIAGPKWRMHQARKLINHLVVEVTSDDQRRVVRQYHVVRSAGDDDAPKTSYEALENILRDPDKRLQLLSDVLRQLVSLRNRYRDIQELAQVWSAVEQAMLTVEIPE
jgi:hypothetical protein